LAASLAAAIVLFAVSWFVLQRVSGPAPRPQGPDRATVKREELKKDLQVALKNAKSNTDRVGVYESQLRSLNLAKIAKDSTDEELSGIVAFYQDDFFKGLLAEANDVPIGHRQELLISLANQLYTTAVDAELTARNQDGAKAEQLRTLADAAKECRDELRKVMYL